ncbi:hypothetical protein [Thalassotalea litorea]|uniref:hypothetical protein n=1 Tax=Thalassotalea litorea TaxID=2020715 RepID=UPI00148586DE|nr:hypothetical protein [Thalassotalea litorea]
MQGFLITDIFGTTPAVHAMNDRLGGSLFIIDPYDGIAQNFTNETAAYQHFQQHVGVNRYADIIAGYLSQAANKDQILIGFSVGASALWRCLTQQPPKSLQGKSLQTAALLFYGSQIRHMPVSVPCVPTNIVLPCSEPHFSISALATSLVDVENVNVTNSEYLHGFMNELSDNFDRQGYQQYLAQLQALMK